MNVVIISVPGQRDFRQLRESISSILPGEIFVLDASVSYVNRNPVELKSADITDVESAIALSHHRARKKAFSMNGDWVLILEDDAIPTSELQNLTSFLDEIGKEFPKDQPLGIHLAPEQFGVMVRNNSRKYLNCLYLADCAVAYVLNRSAVEISIKSNHLSFEVADWPKVLRNLTWVSPIKPFFSHPELRDLGSMSSSSSPRGSRNSKKSILQRFTKYPYLIMLRFWFATRIGTNYGNGYVQSEKIRSKVIPYYPLGRSPKKSNSSFVLYE